MSLRATLDGRKGYSLHVAGNKLTDAHQHDEAQKKYDEALTYYKKAVDGGLTDCRILMAYAVLLMRLWRFDEAHDLMLRVEKIKGLTKEERQQLRQNYAVNEWKRGRLDHAIELMKQAGQNGMNSMIYGSLGYMLIEKARKTGDFSEAEAFNAEAYEYDDEDAVTLDNLGQLNLAQGKREEALKYFTLAHEQKPSQVDTLYYLGLLAHEDGNDDDAREYLEDAVDGRYTALCTTTREQAQALLAQLKPEEE